MDNLLKACEEFNRLIPAHGSPEIIAHQIQRDKSLQNRAREMNSLLNSCGEVHALSPYSSKPSQDQKFRAICWNIERGKNFPKILETLKAHPDLKDADFYFLTEVDWGMARSNNRHVTAELGQSLGYFAYFAPSYYNLSKGHATERGAPGDNILGLHGKALLSRFPLTNLRSVALPNCTDKLRSKETRLGQKRALLADLPLGQKTLTLACTHLDAFSSPRSRRRQLLPAVKSCLSLDHVLLGGDWNTNTFNSTSTLRLISSLLYQTFVVRPVRAIKDHHPHPERRFERPLFTMLEKMGFDYSTCNAPGAGTFDLFQDNEELGQMASDQYPPWVLKTINHIISKAGGNIRFKLDWFAAKKLKCLDRQVVRLNNKASDHHPILLDFQLA